jgi:hypothetical protein
MDRNFLQLRVTCDDLRDLIELTVRVVYGEWSALSTAYTSPSFLSEECGKILRWIETPELSLRIEAGADTGIGWIVLEFCTVDHVGHA